jgi:cytochrome c biogenesis protein
MSTVDERAPATDAPAPPEDRGPGPGGALLAMGRRGWRWLTSMRTALILLFLLAVAAIPGSLLPQRNLNVTKVQQYYVDHPKLAPFLDRIGAFNVFASPWFSAIYLLLFVSLVGCLVPRTRGHVVALLRVPPDAPKRLDRLPAHAGGLALDGDRAEVAARLRDLLRRKRFRVRLREHPDGSRTVSAEKGYLKETGNILFHFSLLAILIGVAYGSLYGYHADRLVVTGADQGFCNTLQQYDDYGLGARVDPSSLEPFCLQLTDFHAQYLANGQPVVYDASVLYSLGTNGTEQATHIKPNHPLRLSKARVYLLGHGYAPVLRYTDRYGKTQTTVAPFLPSDELGTATGVAEFPDANKGTDPNDKQQVAFAGVYVPTAADGAATSAYPAERNPVLVITPYRGDLGLDAGIPHSVYTLDQHQLDNGDLKPVADQPIRLKPGQSATLDDGTKVEFVGTRQWATMSVRYDPGERVVLAGAICLLLGLITMLTGRRRRVWFRVPAEGPVSAGALARGEYHGFQDEFESIVSAATGRDKPQEG